MEDNFQAGGYGERQIEELLQNAIDQLTAPGRVELRLADGALYCANEGSPFGADGIKAVTGAFLSAKKDEKIGRFGLGFKSVLGVTNHPQIISRSISFGFNEPEAQELLAALPYRPERVPTLRVPSVIDADEIAAGDPNIAEMMTWASTIIKLPLVRGGQWLHPRLSGFDARYLLFPERLAEVRITLGSGEARATRAFRRSTGSTAGLVQIDAPGSAPSAWRVLHRDHRISEEVAASLPGLFRREQVRVSYALPIGQGRRDGEFWAYFPLADRTTAQGVFNAPWQTNDDRTSMLPGSSFNRELLEVAAELLIDAALLESTADDPAKHFDVLPARGRETRSSADRYMSERIPQLARRHELIPTTRGELRSPWVVRAPTLKEGEERETFSLPAEAVRIWNEATQAADTPHWSCYTTDFRKTRLRQLLTDENDAPVCTTLPPVNWLSELSRPGTIGAVDAALRVYKILRREKETTWKQFVGSPLLPLDDGTLAPIRDASKVLMPVDRATRPDGVLLIAQEFADDGDVRLNLHDLGVKDVSTDQVAAAAAALSRPDWGDVEWKRLWSQLAKASPGAGGEAIAGVVARGIVVRVPTKAGGWRPARDVFLDPSDVPGVAERQADLREVQGRSDLLSAAGCLDDLVQDYPIHREAAFRQWKAAMQEQIDEEVAKKYGERVRGILRMPEMTGVGPLDILLELEDSDHPDAARARARWTTRVLKTIEHPRRTVTLDFSGKAQQLSVDMNAPERWTAEAFGLIDTSRGPEKLSVAVAKSLDQYDELLPVALESLAGLYQLPKSLTETPSLALEQFMQRTGYRVEKTEQFAEVLGAAAVRGSFAHIDLVPALDVRSKKVVLTPISETVIAAPDELDDLGSLRYIPSGPSNDAIAKAWGVQRASDVVAKSIDWIPAGEPIPLLDVYPTLSQAVNANLTDTAIRRCASIVRRTSSPVGAKEQRLLAYLDGRTVLVDSELDSVDALLRVGDALRLGLREADAASVVKRDEELRKSKLVQEVQAEPTEQGKLLKLVGRVQLAENLPLGLLDLIEQRQGVQSDQDVADLFINTYGNDALRRLKGPLSAANLLVPRNWDGTAEPDAFVASLGFPRAYAGTREKKAEPVTLVPGKVELPELHDFQKTLREQIRELVLIRDKDGEHRRGLLYLPTGAGKTRVTTESIVAMLRNDELGSPVLWIAQSEELCEQAIVSWTEVWRAIGDERPLEITRYWGDYEADESRQELQVVVSTDAKLSQMIGNAANRTAHRWLRESRLVVIDEAHRAGSQRYTQILDWLGISQRGVARTERPLLGLTATPYRGTNEEVNRLFAARFGDRRLNALDEGDPIGQLRDMKVLSVVEHQLLDSKLVIPDSPNEGRGGVAAWDDVSRAILDRLGANLDRTQLLVDHVLRQDREWPILVFTPSVVSAHVTAALIRSLGRSAEAVDGEMRGQERRRKIESFKRGETKVLVNCDLLTQGFDAPKVRALYVARPTFSPNRYVQMVGRGLRGPLNGGTDECLVVNVKDTFTQFDKDLAYTEFDYLWTKKGAKAQ